MDNPLDYRTDHPVMPSEAELIAIMEQSDRDVASGQTVPLSDILAELDQAVKEIEARRRARSA